MNEQREENAVLHRVKSILEESGLTGVRVTEEPDRVTAYFPDTRTVLQLKLEYVSTVAPSDDRPLQMSHFEMFNAELYDQLEVVSE